MKIRRRKRKGGKKELVKGLVLTYVIHYLLYFWYVWTVWFYVSVIIFVTLCLPFWLNSVCVTMGDQLGWLFSHWCCFFFK